MRGWANGGFPLRRARTDLAFARRNADVLMVNYHEGELWGCTRHFATPIDRWSDVLSFYNLPTNVPGTYRDNDLGGLRPLEGDPPTLPIPPSKAYKTKVRLVQHGATPLVLPQHHPLFVAETDNGAAAGLNVEMFGFVAAGFEFRQVTVETVDGASMLKPIRVVGRTKAGRTYDRQTKSYVSEPERDVVLGIIMPVRLG